jgi:hypothetical protein
LELERLLAVDIAFFRYEIERSRSWRRGLRYRDFRMSPRFRRAIGALPTRREILHRLLQAIARILPVPPPPRRTVLDVFAEDVGEAELVLDNLLIAVGPPPDWRPMLSGEDRSVNE